MADGRTVEEKINTEDSSVEIDVPNQMKQITDFEAVKFIILSKNKTIPIKIQLKYPTQ